MKAGNADGVLAGERRMSVSAAPMDERYSPMSRKNSAS
ncbi:MAG: hypothetical protein KatS3mg052_1537 [Candidatus Roseilinea sp.]|nr:MAG: hypothetical protein KatS3mg052_1537 [Candidatus Roseilinea sp.]